jgi:hypothetical protein
MTCSLQKQERARQTDILPFFSFKQGAGGFSVYGFKKLFYSQKNFDLLTKQLIIKTGSEHYQ